MRKRVMALAVSTALVPALAPAAIAQVSTYYARVTGTGAIGNSSGVHAAVHNATGLYTVTFNRDITDCGYVASIVGTASGLVSVTRTTANDLEVRIWNVTGTAANRQFAVIVTCAP
jgi:hypothetical protein